MGFEFSFLAKKWQKITCQLLNDEFIDEMGIAQYRLAKDINAPPRLINEIAQGRRSITADTTLRLGRYFDISPQFWTNLQTFYDLEMGIDKLGIRLETAVKVYTQAT